MTNKQIIPNAIEIAENVAKIIFENSYQSDFLARSFGKTEVKDLLLFGSALTGKSYKRPDEESPKDIDMLIIHQLGELRELGMFTKYDKEKLKVVPDESADITEKRHSAYSILEALGSKFGPCNYEIRDETRDQLRSNVRKRDTYGGNLYISEIGELNIPKKEFEHHSDGFRHIFEVFDKAFDTKVASKFTVNLVEKYLKNQSLEVNSALDLLAMHKDLLNPERGQEYRQDALRQSKKDPTFWNSILTSGRLYNLETGKFDTSFETKYFGIAELFDPEKVEY
ncbi:hypothetical protein HN385_05735 [archaeon]|jgi:hypothetical protein|nr:hypothetical protein [archaeon]MBT3451453.1 hypothetical protein [archaeon]MBT6868553.1 hypothetical protein [archaeon]MBT7193087.1 hypothetical protein [archaeon]MBT7381176.1 hypothetical protein [archaeon]